jgi:hypothetical protein
VRVSDDLCTFVYRGVLTDEESGQDWTPQKACSFRARRFAPRNFVGEGAKVRNKVQATVKGCMEEDARFSWHGTRGGVETEQIGSVGRFRSRCCQSHASAIGQPKLAESRPAATSVGQYPRLTAGRHGAWRRFFSFTPRVYVPSTAPQASNPMLAWSSNWKSRAAPAPTPDVLRFPCRQASSVRPQAQFRSRLPARSCGVPGFPGIAHQLARTTPLVRSVGAPWSASQERMWPPCTEPCSCEHWQAEAGPRARCDDRRSPSDSDCLW